MPWQNFVLYSTLAFYLAGFAFLLLKRFVLGRGTLVVASLLSMTTFLSFVYAYLSNDFALKAVFESSSQSLPIPFKLAAVWSGAGGSLLLWLAIMSSALLAYEIRGLVVNRERARTTSLIVSFFIIYIGIAVVFLNPFAEVGTPFSNGLGLTPSLQSFWTLIHPPTVFSAYTAVMFLFSGFISRRWEGQQQKSQATDRRLLSATWTLLTLGIGFGGIWAYQTLGWGGYWSWDPIETSALIPWLALTAVLLSSWTRRGGKGDHMFLGITFSASTLQFTAYVARNSVAPSIHGYGELVTGAPLILLALFPVIISVGAVMKNRLSGEETAGTVRAERASHAWEFWCLILLASANLLLLLVESFAPDFGVMFLPSTQLHNYVSFPFVVAFCSIILIQSLGRPKMRFALGVYTVILGGGLALWFTSVLTSNLLFDLGLPFIVALLVSAAYGITKTTTSHSGRLFSTSAIRYATCIGVSILLLGVFFSSSMQTSAAGGVQVGQGISVNGEHLTVLSISTMPSDGKVYLPTYGSVPESIDTSVVYSLNGQTSQDALLKYYPSVDQFFAVPSIQSSITEDVYVVVGSTSSVAQATSQAFRNGTTVYPSEVYVSITTIPGMSLVVLGIAVMIIANLLLVFAPASVFESSSDPETEKASQSSRGLTPSLW